MIDRTKVIPRLRANTPMDMAGMIDMIIALWQEVGNNEVVMKFADMSKWEDYPCVALRTISSVLPTDQRERRPRHRETIIDPERQDEFIEMLGQVRENIIEFKIYALTPDEADILHEKFEDFLFIYTPHFTQQGIQKFYFYRQLEDGLITEWHNPVITRTVQYQVRIERVTFVRMGELNDIHISIQHPL